MSIRTFLLVLAALLTLTGCVGPRGGGSDTEEPDVFRELHTDGQGMFMR